MDSLSDDEIVYIGKDSYIGKHQRRKDHLAKSRYNDQPFNRILQNNPTRYEYKISRIFNKFSSNSSPFHDFKTLYSYLVGLF